MRKKPSTFRSGRPPTETVSIHSPTVPGASDRVERVIDAIAFLARRFPLEFAVATRIRRAYDLIGQEVGGAADFDRLRGGSRPGTPPPVARLDAAHLLTELDRASIKNLDDLGRALITLTVCRNMTLTSIAQFGLAKQHGRDWYGTRLRLALRAVGDHWGWTERDYAREIRSFRRDRAAVTDSTTVKAGGVVHATGRRIFRATQRST